jgi:hypothetical protein
VDRISTPSAASPCANSATPVLSDTLISARCILFIRASRKFIFLLQERALVPFGYASDTVKFIFTAENVKLLMSVCTQTSFSTQRCKERKAVEFFFFTDFFANFASLR